ncbi:hypothetical protein N2152v2_009440 [Parachlorella kessleri]
MAAAVTAAGVHNRATKPQNQDAFVLERLQPASQPQAALPAAILLGVLDGHGPNGHLAAQHISAQLAAVVRERAAQALACPRPRDSVLWWEAEFLVSICNRTGSSWGALGAEACGASSLSQDQARDALEQAFSQAAQSIATVEGCDFSLSGATAVACLVLPDSVVALWCGDSRAVVGRRGLDGSCIATPLTRDHKPGDPEEVARIRAAGGRVVRAQDKSGNPIGESGEPCACAVGRRVGPCRVTPNVPPGMPTPGLSVARAFGDLAMSSCGILPLPEFAVLPRGTAAGSSPGTPTSITSLRATQQAQYQKLGGQQGPQEVLVAATDGLWDVLSNQEAVEQAFRAGSPEEAAQLLVEVARERWAAKSCGRHADDITAVVAFL